MNRSKKIFLIISAIFIIIVLFFAYDLMRRTSPPWEKQGEQLEKY